MTFPRLLSLLLVSSCIALPQTISVGTGAPNGGIGQEFISAFYRGSFQNLVVNPPLNAVHALGSTGLVQEFASINSTGNSTSTPAYALVRSVSTGAVAGRTDPVQQVLDPMYSYYGSVGVNTAGYPLNDTANCPALSNPANVCQFQIFDKGYALFAYLTNAGPLSGQKFSVAAPFYAALQAMGGVTVLGPAVAATATVTSSFGSAATDQVFDQGAIYNITSGTLTGRLVTITQPIYGAYAANNGYLGQLGFPSNNPLVLANGDYSQTFEGGSIEYNPASPSTPPVIHFPVSGLSITPTTSSLNMNLGDKVTLTATVYDINGATVTDRPVVWTTSNGQVVSLQPNGETVVLTAVGGGTAYVSATSGGKTSPSVRVTVSAPCCQIGAGAPTQAIQQAFQNAVTRNHLSVKLPAANPVTRVGSGYVQVLQPADPSLTATYLIAVSDQSGTGYLVTGAILAAYQTAGGPAGALGYPTIDPTAGGRQLFQNSVALAGSPVQQVTGAILAKWATLGYETGVAGSPTAAASAFLTFRGTSGLVQSFQNALVVATTSGAQAGQTYFLSGLVLAGYNGAGALTGDLGAPLNDEYGINGMRQQDFEGGSIGYAPGAAVATVVKNPRKPLVTAMPATVLSGSRVQLAAGGFDNGATLRVSVSGQPDFIVTAPTGAYAWGAYVPANATSAVVTIQVVDVNSGASASGSYTVTPLSAARLSVSALRGDSQTGAPGAVLLQPLVASVTDSSGNPAPAIPVQFTASPGAQIVSASQFTDANGQATAVLRLPLLEGVSLATAAAAGQIATFSARSLHITLTNFPSLPQTSSAILGNGSDTLTAKGALVAAAASILQYHQNRNELPEPNGLSTPASLNQFLKSFCVSDSQGAQICDGFVTPANSQEQIVNLWRVGAFVGGNISVSVVNPALPAIRDLIAQGFPVLVALSLSSGSTPLGAHFVVGVGINADGSIAIADPNPVFGRSNLNDYLAGFGRAAGSAATSGTISAAIRLIPTAPASAGFLVISASPVVLTSPSGGCGVTAQWLNFTATGQAPSQAPGVIGFTSCDGSQNIYQLDINATGAWQASFTDLGSPGSHAGLNGGGASSFKVAGPAPFTAAPLDVSLTAGGVVNAASFTSDLAPGALAAIYGSGLVRAGTPVSVQLNGETAPVVAATPFQVNAQIPLDAAPGPAALHISSSYGTADQSVTLLAGAPEIFLVGTAQAAILNQDNSLNSASNPATRGSVIVIYCTGLGAVAPQGSTFPAIAPVTVALGTAQLPVEYAGLTPGFLGLYQVNLPIPPQTPPDLGLTLFLQQAGMTGKPVSVAVQ